MDRPTYRPDIDGLRAVAVSAVVIFHLNEGFVTAGFLGVDMFFVISGYLITGILWQELLNGSFSIVEFYKRRIRRLLPALLVMMSAVSLAAYFLLVPWDLVGFAESLLSALAFLANVYFWRDTNYFAAAADLKPLLNLWSLGVEEQFYIFFPFVLWGLAKLKWRPLPVVVALVVMSLALHYLLSRAGGEAPAFYLLPTRAWELGAGAIAALAIRPTVGPAASSVLRAAAMGFIVVGFWPNFWPLPASLQSVPLAFGTALLLWIGAPPSTWIGRSLALPPLNFIGRISYSLYLWHWPIIVLAQYYLIRALTPLEAVAAGAASVVISVLSWHLVESPSRHRLPFPSVVRLALTLATLLAIFAAVVLVTAGLPSRLPSQAAMFSQSIGTNYRCAVSDLRPFGASRACDLTLNGQPIETTVVALVGNSHAQMYAPLLRDHMSQAGIPASLFPLNGCLPTVTVNISPSCLDAAATNLTEISKLPNLAVVIIAFDWPFDRELYDPSGHAVGATDELLRGVDDLLVRLADKRVVLVGPVKTPGFDIASVLSRQVAYGRTPQAEHSTSAHDFVRLVDSISTEFGDRDGVVLIRPDRVQCHDAVCDFVRNDVVLFADDNHLAESALVFFRPLWASGMDVAIGTNQQLQ